MTTMNNEDPADPSVHEHRAKEPCGDNPAADVALPPPVAWVQPDHLQKARMAPFLCRVEPTQRHADFVPIYTADQMRAAIATEREQLECVRQALPEEWRNSVPSVAVATITTELSALRERTDIADAARVIAWASSSPRRPAHEAFTAGPERQATYWIEWAQRGMDRVDVARLVADCVPGGHVCDPQQVADAIRAWFAMTDDAVNTGPASPASDLPQPAAWVRNWTSPQPDCVTSLKYRSAADADRGVEYHPAYTADQMRAATAAMRAQDSEHRSAQAAVYAALGPGADPDRATWPDQIRALRERADALARAIAAVAGIAHAGGLSGMSEHDALAAIRLILA